MSNVLQNSVRYASGALSAIDRAKLTPENIRNGIVLFEGTDDEIVGTADILDDTDYIKNHGITITPGYLYIAPGHSNEPVNAITTPTFDISTYDTVTFMNCTLSTIGPGHITSYRCSVLKNGATVAYVSGKDGVVDVSNITGAVQFQLTGYATCASGNGNGWSVYNMTFENILLQRLNK